MYYSRPVLRSGPTAYSKWLVLKFYVVQIALRVSILVFRPFRVLFGRQLSLSHVWHAPKRNRLHAKVITYFGRILHQIQHQIDCYELATVVDSVGHEQVAEGHAKLPAQSLTLDEVLTSQEYTAREKVHAICLFTDEGHTEEFALYKRNLKQTEGCSAGPERVEVLPLKPAKELP